MAERWIPSWRHARLLRRYTELHDDLADLVDELVVHDLEGNVLPALGKEEGWGALHQQLHDLVETHESEGPRCCVCGCAQPPGASWESRSGGEVCPDCEQAIHETSCEDLERARAQGRRQAREETAAYHRGARAGGGLVFLLALGSQLLAWVWS